MEGSTPPPRLCDVLLEAGLSDVYLPYIDGYLQALETIEREYRTNDAFKQVSRHGLCSTPDRFSMCLSAFNCATRSFCCALNHCASHAFHPDPSLAHCALVYLSRSRL